MSSGLKFMLFLGALCLTGTVHAITGYTALRDTSGPGGGVVLEYYEPANDQKREEYDNFLSSLLSFYLSENIAVKDDKFKLKKDADAMCAEMSELVSGSVSFFNHRSRQPFGGFSNQLRNAIVKLEREKLEVDEFGDLGPGKELLRRMVVDSRIDALHTTAMKEVKAFSSSRLMTLSSSDEAALDPATMERIVEEMLSYDPNAPLQPLPGDDEDKMVRITLQDNSTLTLPDEDQQTNQDDFAQKVYALLEQQNAKLDNMQAQIDQVRTDQLAMWKSQQEKTNADLQAQISDLRNIVVQLVEGISGKPIPVVPVTPAPTLPPAVVANLPPSVTVTFAKNSDDLNAIALLSLNELVDILARNPGISVIITGHADRTGTEMQNLVLSNQRAQSVKKFFTNAGLDGDRFVTQYLGQRDSPSENPADRKVTLTFVAGS